MQGNRMAWGDPESAYGAFMWLMRKAERMQAAAERAHMVGEAQAYAYIAGWARAHAADLNLFLVNRPAGGGDA